MMEGKFEDDDEVSLKEVLAKLHTWYAYLLSKLSIILIASIIGGFIGLTYAWLKKPIYTAECTFVLEDGDKGGLGQYSGLASMVGIDLGGSQGSGLFQGDNIIQLYKSRLIIKKTLLSEAMFGVKKQRLVNRYVEFNKLKLDNVTEGDLNFSTPFLSIKQDSIIIFLTKQIITNALYIEKIDKKLNIINVGFNSEDELFAKEFTERIVQNVNDFYTDTKTRKSNQNVSILQKQADSVRSVLNRSLGGSASAADANPNANAALQILRVPQQRRQIDVQASSAIYAEIVKNLELAKISLRKETPLIQIIDSPLLPLDRTNVNMFFSIFLGGLIGGIIGIVYLTLTRSL